MPKFIVATYFKTLYMEKKTIEVEAKTEEEAYQLCEKIGDEQLNNDTYWDDVETLEVIDLPVENISPMFIENDGPIYPEFDPFWEEEG